MSQDASRHDLKRQLLEGARKRKRSRPAPEHGEASGTSAGEVPERLTRFDAHPGYQQLTMMREAARRLGLTDPFFRCHQATPAPPAASTTGTSSTSPATTTCFSGDPRVNQAAIDAVQHYGSSVSASRIVSGERPIHGELERAIADTYQVDDAVVFVSGHATNVSTLGYLLGPGDLILHDEYIHNSALVAPSSPAPGGWASRTTTPMPGRSPAPPPGPVRARRDRHRGALQHGRRPARPAPIRRDQAPSPAWLMVDEAHSFGVLGRNGRGLREHFDVPPEAVDIWMGTMSKTLAGCGGYIAGCQALVDTCATWHRGFSTASACRPGRGPVAQGAGADA